MVVMEPETAMATIPRESEIRGANEFARFSHGQILPVATDKIGEALSAP